MVQPSDPSVTAMPNVPSRLFDRRGVTGGMAALLISPAIVGSAVLGTTGSAMPFTHPAESDLKACDARFAIHGGTIIDGYFTGPRGKTNLGVVIVVHDRRGLDDSARDLARRYALAGYYAIAPDLNATFAGGTHQSKVARLVETVPNLRRFPHGDGRVNLVAAT